MRTRAAGNVIYDGKMMNFTSPKDAMNHGFALITEERKANGLFLKADITFNTTIANMNHYKSGLTIIDNVSGCSCTHTKYRLKKLCTTCTDQSIQTKYLAFSDFRIAGW